MEHMKFTESINVKTVSEDEKAGVFEIGGLYKGYGVMIGNSLRRVLISSMPGASVTQIKIKGVSHEFTTIPDVLEDVVELALNMKRVRFRLHTDEPQVLTLKVKGEKKVTAADIVTNANVQVINTDAHIATLTTKKAELDMELTVERGLGYVSADQRKIEKLPIGVVALDAIFSPVMKTNFSVENMRVGDRADYNKIIISIETDGSITPSQALNQAAIILKDHFENISGLQVLKADLTKPEATKKRTVKKKKAEKEVKE